MNQVIVLSGPSGCGKTTYAEKLARTARLPAIISADDFFTTDKGYHFDPSRLGEAHNDCFARFIIVLTLQEADMVIVDNTNTHIWEVAPYMLAGQAFKYDTSLHIFQAKPADLDLCAGRGLHGVGLWNVMGQANRIIQMMGQIPQHWKTVPVPVR